MEFIIFERVKLDDLADYMADLISCRRRKNTRAIGIAWTVSRARGSSFGQKGEAVMVKRIQTKPEPYCPACGAKMQLRKPRADQSWGLFWGCSQFPACNGTREIREDGTPETDDYIAGTFGAIGG